MDSLARILDVYGTRVTSTGVGDHESLLVAANLHPGGTRTYSAEVGRRVDALRRFVGADFGSTRELREGAQTVFSDLGSLFNQRRFMRDLLKLRRSLRGEYGRDSGKNFSDTQQRAILRGELRIYGGDDVHAELDVGTRSEPGPIGVSKLSCRDCHDYIVSHRDDVALRGTHGHRFRGWKDPNTRRNANYPASHGNISAARQMPEDSDSEPDE